MCDLYNEKEPDLVIGNNWVFYFDEMLQYNVMNEQYFTLAEDTETKELLWHDRSVWNSYHEMMSRHEVSTIWDEYMKYAVEKELLGD